MVVEVSSSLDLSRFLTTIRVETCGEAYLNYQTVLKSGHDELDSCLADDNAVDEVSDDFFREPKDKYLNKLDPAKWKDQDHYKCLGLDRLRHKATAEQIRKAYRHMVMRHHPDKRQDGRTDCQYFTCITKAYETLSNPVKRRSYDSIDPGFDEEVPAVNAKSKKDFFATFSPVFEWNSRWSDLAIRGRIPLLGDEKSTYEQVEEFYTFWYNFKSWREFSYLDEEDSSQGECREERRWIERQNMKMRRERKKEETGRIARLVENARLCDPRIAHFEAAARAEKEAKKAEREAEKKRVADEEKRKLEEVEAAKVAAELAEKKRLIEEKAARNKEKERAKNTRKKLRNALKAAEYCASGEDEKIQHMHQADKLLEFFTPAQLADFYQEFSALELAGEKRSVFERATREMEGELSKQMADQQAASQPGAVAAKSGDGPAAWSREELATLIKAMGLFPNGTRERWNVISTFMTTHLPGCVKTGKAVLAKAKELQGNDSALRNAAIENNLTDVLGSSTPEIAAAPSERDEAQPWSNEEQKLLEQALKTYPTSTVDRWDVVAGCVKTRSKKECILRYKELSDLIKAKRAALAATQKK